MTTQDFLQLLSAKSDKELWFEYQEGKFIPAEYHITEVKNVSIESVDCGGNEHSEKQTVVQLWSPLYQETGPRLLAEKALKIFDVVNQKRPLQKETPIFFEYGNRNTPTSVYMVDKVVEDSARVILQMSVPPTVCKPKLTLTTEAQAAGCCTPNDQGCC